MLGSLVDRPMFDADCEVDRIWIDNVNTLPDDRYTIFDDSQGKTDLVHYFLGEDFGITSLRKVERAFEHGSHLDGVRVDRFFIAEVLNLLGPDLFQQRTYWIGGPFVNVWVDLG